MTSLYKKLIYIIGILSSFISSHVLAIQYWHYDQQQKTPNQGPAIAFELGSKQKETVVLTISQTNNCYYQCQVNRATLDTVTQTIPMKSITVERDTTITEGFIIWVTEEANISMLKAQQFRINVINNAETPANVSIKCRFSLKEGFPTTPQKPEKPPVSPSPIISALPPPTTSSENSGREPHTAIAINTGRNANATEHTRLLDDTASASHSSVAAPSNMDEGGCCCSVQ